MLPELQKIENLLFKSLNKKITNLAPDLECEEYCGFNFNIENWNVKFRKAKITPKKIGQFVTLWKRNSQGETEPFRNADAFDFYIIAANKNENFGVFFFPKSVLSKNHILTTETKEGKRGFRIYPPWDNPQNKQAEKSQKWQTEYFFDLTSTDNLIDAIESINKLLTK